MTNPNIFQIDTYRNGTAPKATTFGVGAHDLKDIEHATNARRELSRKQSPKENAPEKT